MELQIPKTVTSSYDDLEKLVAATLKSKKLGKSHLTYSDYDTVNEGDYDIENWIVKYPDFEGVIEGTFEFKHLGKMENPLFKHFIWDAGKDVLLRQPCDHVFLERIYVEDGKVRYFFGS